MTAAVMQLAGTKGSVRKLRHKVREVYSPLQGRAGLSEEEQLSRIDAALERLNEARVALEEASLVIRVRNLRNVLTDGEVRQLEPVVSVASAEILDVDDGSPDFEDLPVAVAGEPLVTGFDNIDALLREAWAMGFNASVEGRTANSTNLRLVGDVADISFAISNQTGKLLNGSWVRASDGKTLSIRKPYSVRAALEGVAKN